MIKKMIYLLVLLLVLSCLLKSKQAAVLPELQKPGTIVVDKDQIFINDGATVYIYSSKDFKLQTKFGERGEGPGEFKTHPNIHRGGVGLSIHPDYILASSITRVTFFTRGGKYLRDVSTRSILGQFTPLGEKFVGTGIAQDSSGDYYTANIYNENFEKEKEVFREKGIGRKKKLNAVAMLKFPQLYVCDNKIFVNSDDGVIHVFDPAGEKRSTIELGMEKVKVTSERKKRYDDFYKTDMRFKPRYEDLKQIAAYPEYFPAIRNYLAVDKKIYVVTYREQDKKKELLILDLEGNLLKKTFVPLKEMNVLELFPYTIHKGTIYQLVENPESEEWELHTLEID
jgi:hypothetical protein